MTILGRLLASSPEPLVRAFCWTIGTAIAYFPARRSLVARSNLSHCFPSMTEREIKKTAAESARRMVEMAMFVVSSPYISDARLRSKIKVSPYVLGELEKISKSPRPTILMIPHFCMMETITMFPLLVDVKIPRTGVFYRPFNSPAMENRVRLSRERFGLELLSRKKGLGAAIDFLKEKGIVAILFDQDAGGAGVRSLFFNRLCSTSELAGFFTERVGADCAVFYAKRTGFWSSVIDGTRICESSREGVVVAANKWLEAYLLDNPELRSDWLWLHKRWFINRWPSDCLRIKYGKSILPEDMRLRGLSTLPRTDRIFVIAPSSREKTYELLKALPLLRKSRSDAFVTLLCPQAFAAEAGAEAVASGAADGVIALPERALGFMPRVRFFCGLMKKYPDIAINFDIGLASDIETFLLKAPLFLAASGGKKRRLPTCARDTAEPICSEDFKATLQFFGARDQSPQVLSENSDLNL